MSRLLSRGAFAGALVFITWLVLLRPASFGGPASYVVVSGTSMRPTLTPGDLAVLVKDDSYGLGDVVAFRVDEGVVIHRVVGGSAADGFITRGDSKDAQDLWRPRPEQILGKMWLSIPQGGQLLLLGKQPEMLGLFSLALGGLLAFGAAESPRGRPNRRRRPPRAWPTPGLVIAGAVALVAALVGILGTVATFRWPAETSVPVERSRYEHHGRLDYVARTRPSVVYEGEIVGTGQLLYTRLTKSIDVSFAYALTTATPGVASGEHALDLRIAAREGWAKTVSLSDPTAFSGTTVVARGTIDMASVLDLISEAEKETGVVPATYELAVMPIVRVHGQAGPQDFDDTFGPTFAFELTRTQIKPPKDREVREPHILTEEATREALLTVGGVSLSVRLARWASLALVALAIAALGSLATSAVRELQRSEASRIHARYGSLLVRVVDGDGTDDVRRVRLASMHDLARVAQRGNGLVLEQELPGGGRVYYVRDDGARYEYRLDGVGPAPEGQSLVGVDEDGDPT